MADTNDIQELLRKAKAFSDAEFNTANQDFYQPDPAYTRQQQRLSPPNRKAEQEAKLGAPLDTEKGAPFLQRVGAAFRTEPEQVLKYWQDLYGKDNVKLLDSGDFAVRVLGDDGKQKFLSVDEDRLTLKDLDSIAGVAPEIVGTIVGVRTGKGIPAANRFWQWGRDLVAGSAGAELAGAAKDMTVRGIDQMPIEPGTVLKNRAVQFGVDLGLGAGLAAGTKIIGKVITPFGGEIPKIQFDAREAAEYWASKMPKDQQLKYSAGEKTGSVFLQRSEAELKKLPGASGPFDDLRAQQNASIQHMQEIVQGGASGNLPSMEAVGQRVQRVLRDELEPSEKLIANARSKLVGEAHDEALKVIDTQTLPVRMDHADDIGKAIRAKVMAERNDFTAGSALRYNTVRSLPGGSDRILVPGKISKDAADYLQNKLPTKEVIREIDTGIADAKGNAIIRTESGREVLREFVPDGVVNRLKALAATGDTKFSLQDLIEMRNDVFNAIAEGEAVPGVRTHHLKQIREMLTGAIQQGVDSIPDKTLRTAYESAEKYYKDGVSRFHTKLVSTILKEPTAPGAIGDADIFKRVIGGEDRIDELKEFLGSNSPEFKMLKRGIADRIYRDSQYAGQELINAKAFLGNLDALAKNQPKVFGEVFGSGGRHILQQAQLMTVGQADKIDSAILDQGIRNTRSIPNLQALINAQREQDKLYKNKILKAIGSNSLPGEGIEPNQFLNRFVDSAAPDQIKKVMGMLESADPDAARLLRAKAMQKLLSDAGRKPGPMDKVALRLDENRVVNTEALQTLLKDPEKKRVYEAMIGGEGLEMLDMLAKAVKPIEAKDRAFAAAGGISAGMQIGRFWQGGLLGFADKAVHNLVGGFVLTTPGIRQLVSNNLMTPDRVHSLFKLSLYSEPAIKAFANDYGDAAPQVYQRLNDAMDASLGQQWQAATNVVRGDDQRALELLNRVSASRTNAPPQQLLGR